MGLRADKKRKVRLDIERAALTLVLERGFDGVTVEDVCAAAEISKKTFFNYFPSKASAVLGAYVPFPSAEELTSILEERADEQYLDVLVDVLGTRMGPGDDPEVARLRVQAFKAMPTLFFQGQREHGSIHRVVTQAVCAYLLEHPERRLMANLEPAREALVASSCATNVARVRSMFRVDAGCEMGVGEARSLVAGYLAATCANRCPAPACGRASAAEGPSE